jgi:hypothetical protein
MNIIKAQIDIIKKLFDGKSKIGGCIDPDNKRVYLSTVFYAYSIPFMDCMINMDRIKESPYLSEMFNSCDIGSGVRYTGLIKDKMLIFEDSNHYKFGINKKFLDAVDIKRYDKYLFIQKEKHGVVYVTLDGVILMVVMPIQLKGDVI